MVFYESCFYFSGLFSDICKKKYPIYLTYKNFFEKTEFYLKNKDNIEKYPILMPCAPENIKEGFKLMWVGDKKYFS